MSVLKQHSATPKRDRRQEARSGTEHSHQRPACIYLMLTICVGTCTHTRTQGKVCNVMMVLKAIEIKGSKGGCGMVHKGTRLHLSLPCIVVAFRWPPAPLHWHHSPQSLWQGSLLWPLDEIRPLPYVLKAPCPSPSNSYPCLSSHVSVVILVYLPG